MTEHLWTADDVAAYLKRSPRKVLERMRYKEGFPQAILLPVSKRPHPLWVPSEIRAWALDHRDPDTIPTDERKPLNSNAA